MILNITDEEYWYTIEHCPIAGFFLMNMMPLPPSYYKYYQEQNEIFAQLVGREVKQ